MNSLIWANGGERLSINREGFDFKLSDRCEYLITSDIGICLRSTGQRQNN